MASVAQRGSLWGIRKDKRTARAAGATAFVTNDRRIKSRPGLEVLYLDDLEVGEPVP